MSHPSHSKSPVRVLIVDNALAFGGALTVVRNLIAHLDPAKVSVTLVTACTEDFINKDSPACVAIHRKIPYSNYLRVQEWKERCRALFGAGRMGHVAARLTIVYGILRNVPYMLALASLCIRARTQVLHINNPSLESLWISRALRLRTLIQLHGFMPGPTKSIRRAVGDVAAWVSISDGVHAAAVAAGVDPARIHRISNFVERSANPVAPEFPAVPTVGIFGRIIPWKGQKEFLHAIRIVLKDFPGAKALVVGGASDGAPGYMDECRAMVAEWGLADRIEFTGMIRDVTQFYRRCSVVAHASIEPEPFGMVLIEAMAEGRPVVGSSLGAAAEVIASAAGDCGFIADPRDPAEFAAKLAVLLADPELAKTMGGRGLYKVLHEYDPGVAARRFEALYRQVSQC